MKLAKGEYLLFLNNDTNEISYLIMDDEGNEWKHITQEEYKAKSADLQKKIAELSKKPVLKTQNFTSNWKDLYCELDEEHRRLFWRNLVSEIRVNLEGQAVEILY